MRKNILQFIILVIVVFGLSGCQFGGEKVVVEGNQEVGGEEMGVLSEKNKENLKQGIKKELPEDVNIDVEGWKECKKLDLGIKIMYPGKYPKRWSCNENEVGFRFLTQEFKSRVFLNAELNFNNSEDIKNYIDKQENCEYKNISDGKIFYNCKNEKVDEVIIGKIMNNDIYVFTWKVDSNQKITEDVKDIWYPDVNFSILDLREIVRSAEIITMERNEKFSENAYIAIEKLLRSKNLDISLYKIFEEIKNPFQPNVSAILFGLDPEKEKIDKCCSEPIAIAINNNGQFGKDYLFLTGALHVQYLKNVKWLDKETAEYSSVLAYEEGMNDIRQTIKIGN